MLFFAVRLRLVLDRTWLRSLARFLLTGISFHLLSG